MEEVFFFFSNKIHLSFFLSNFSLIKIFQGNGTLAINILNYIQEHHPKIYENTSYSIIEISKKMAEQQRKNRDATKHKNLKIIQKSIVNWDDFENEPCFIIGTEVLVLFLKIHFFFFFFF